MHAEMFPPFDLPTKLPKTMVWKMPKDFQAVPGLLESFKHGSVSDTLPAHFQEVLVTDDVDGFACLHHCFRGAGTVLPKFSS